MFMRLRKTGRKASSILLMLVFMLGLIGYPTTVQAVDYADL